MKNYNDQKEANYSTGTRQGMSVGLFRNRESAERAYNILRERGYTGDEINLVMSDDTRKRYFPGGKAGETEPGTKTITGKGTVVGGTVGTMAGMIAAIGAGILLPGLGLVVAGPFVAGLVGAGGLTGGLVGALVGSGIPEERVRIYGKGLKEGGIAMGVRPHDEVDAEYIENTWGTTGNSNAQTASDTKEGNLNDGVEAGDEGTLHENSGYEQEGSTDADSDYPGTEDDIGGNTRSAVQANEEKTNKGDDEGFLRGYEDDEMDASTFTEDDETGNDLDEEDTGLANEDENKEEDRYKGENI